MILQQKRHLCLLAVSYVFGTVLYCRRGDVWWALLVVLGAILAYGIATGGKRRERMAVTALVLGLILTAFLVCRCQDRSYEQVQDIVQSAPGWDLSGRVYRKEIQSDRCLYYLHTSYHNVIVYDDTDEIPIGAEVAVRGKWQAFSPATNEGAFDFAEDYRARGIAFRVYADDMTQTRAPRLLFREGLYRLQQRISAVFADSLNEREAGVLSQLTVGNKGRMDPDVRELYQSVGISHILAISGLHISILGFGVYRFLRRLHLPRHACEAIGCGLVFCFVLMSGMGTSAIRALVMYLFMMGASAIGRTYDMPTALAAAALVLLIPHPMNLYRSGFQFSFLAMAAIGMVTALTRRAKERREAAEREAHPAGMPPPGGKERGSRLRRVGQDLRARLAFGAFLQLALLPLTAWHYYEVPLYATFLNLLVLPLCSALLGFGLAGGVLGIFFPQVAKWLLIPCHVILRIYEGLATGVNRLPGHTWITGQPSPWMMLAFYLALFGVCALALFRPRGLSRWMALAGLLPLALLAVILFVPERQYARVDFLDVGQGDGIYLTDGAGARVMIDGGSSSEGSVGQYEIEPFLKSHGIRRVDVWILTHGDSDHYSGLLELLTDGYRIDRLLLAEAMPRDDTWAELTAAAEANGTEVLYAQSGDRIALSGGAMTCIFPSADAVASESASSDANELSQVWSLDVDGLSVLFTGDIGADEERLLLESGALTDRTVLKVAHHGSKYSSCEEFLAAVSPEYAVISCGANNIYGHPAPETVERLVEAGCEIYQTPQSGQVTFYETRDVWKLRTFTP